MRLYLSNQKYMSVSTVLMVIYIITGYIAQNVILPAAVNSLVLYMYIGWTALNVLGQKRVGLDSHTLWHIAIIIYSAVSGFIAPYGSTANLYTMFVALVLSFCMQYTISSKEKLIICARSYAVAATLLVIGLAVTGNLITDERLGEDLLDGANKLGTMFAISSALTAWLIVYRCQTTKEKFLYIGMYAAQLLALILSEGRKSVLIAVAALILFLYMKEGRDHQKHTIIKTILIAIIVFIACYALINNQFLYDTIGYRFEMLLNISQNNEAVVDTGDVKRIQMIEYGLQKWLDSPVIGYGFDSFKQYNYLECTGKRMYSHNNYVEVLFDLGIIGFILYYSAYVRVAKYAVRKKWIHADLKALSVSIVFVMLLYDVGSVSLYGTLPQMFLTLAVCSNRIEQLSY